MFNTSRGVKPGAIVGLGCAAFVVNIALFIGGVAVIAYAIKWVIS